MGKYKALISFYEKTISRVIYAGDTIELPESRAKELEGFVELVKVKKTKKAIKEPEEV